MTEKKPQAIKKEMAVDEIKQHMAEASMTVLADYRGLDVAEVTELRAKLRKAGVTFKVAKNTLVKIAAHDLGIMELDNYLEGPTAVAFTSDPVEAAKILTEFAKTHPKLEMKSGILDKKLLSADQLKDLAKLPTREVLLAMVVGGMQAPLAGFAGSLAGVLRKFVYALDQVREQKASA